MTWQKPIGIVLMIPILPMLKLHGTLLSIRSKARWAQHWHLSLKKNMHVYAGNTAVGTSPSGRKFRDYYGKDGKVVYSDSKGLTQIGKWIITDDGMMRSSRPNTFAALTSVSI